MSAGVCHRCHEAGGCICREIEPVVTEHDLALDTIWQAAKKMAAAHDDSVLLLARHAQRYLAGMGTYGALNLDLDRREFLREALEELCDATYYLEASLKKMGE